MPLLYVSNLHADDDCGAVICAVNPSMEDERAAITTAVETKAAAEQSAFDAVSDTAFEPQEEMASSGCLDGLMGLNLNATIIDPRNLSLSTLSDEFLDKIMALGCAAIVEKMNEQISAVNDQLNEQLSVIGEMSGGLIEISSSTNTTGTFGASGTVTQIEDSELGAELSDEINAEINEKIFGDSGVFGGAGDIDFFYLDGNVNSTTNEIDVDAQEKLDEMVCWLGGCN